MCRISPVKSVDDSRNNTLSTTSLPWSAHPSGGGRPRRPTKAVRPHRAAGPRPRAAPRVRQCDVITMPSLWLASWPGARPVPRVCRLVARLWCAPPVCTWLAQRLERRPHLGGKEVGLFPGGEVAAPVDPFIVDEVV